MIEGRTSINVESIADITKEEFITRFKGKFDIDINQVWKRFSKEAKQYKKEPEKQVSKKKKKASLD